ncbi:MAG: methyltransferase domain-containing protein, partial [Candidatus Thermoplasmatota archaeon]
MIGRGDLVALVDGNGRRFILRVEDELREYNFGIYNPIKLLGHSYGSNLRIGRVEYTLFRAGIVDIISSLKRKTQIITPKDIGTIIINCNIIPGAKVVEGGVGTGALTIALASFVSPNGKVIGYENKLETIEIAKKNIISVGLDELVLIKEKDIKEGIDEKDIDAVILDIPDPWEVIKHAYKAL